jgi:hypothetical protein
MRDNLDDPLKAITSLMTKTVKLLQVVYPLDKAVTTLILYI